MTVKGLVIVKRWMYQRMLRLPMNEMQDNVMQPPGQSRVSHIVLFRLFIIIE